MCVVILPVYVSVLVCPGPPKGQTNDSCRSVFRIKPRSSGNISRCSLVQSHLLSTKNMLLSGCFSCSPGVLYATQAGLPADLVTKPCSCDVYVIPA